MFYSLPQSLLTSETYEKLLDLIHRDKVIPAMNSFWDEIEGLVLEYYPSFKKNLIILTNGRLTMNEYQTSLLIKLGIPMSKIAILLGRARGSIYSRKKELGKKIFGEYKSTDIIDSKIQSL